MNAASDKGLASALRALVGENEAARRLFKRFAGRKNDAREMNVERAAWLASSDYQTMLGVFKELDRLGAGVFVVGRHGYASRIQWNYSIRSLGEIAMGESNLPEDVPADAVAEDLAEDGDEETGNASIKHEFQLRQGFKVQFALPADLTEKEAERLGQFVKTLPF